MRKNLTIIIMCKLVASRILTDLGVGISLNTADVWGGGNVTNHDSRAIYVQVSAGAWSPYDVKDIAFNARDVNNVYIRYH